MARTVLWRIKISAFPTAGNFSVMSIGLGRSRACRTLKCRQPWSSNVVAAFFHSPDMKILFGISLVQVNSEPALIEVLTILDYWFVQHVQHTKGETVVSSFLCKTQFDFLLCQIWFNWNQSSYTIFVDDLDFSKLSR